ncbi:MAG: DUF4440 domain-containing protein [Anaerolineae bacterium]|nr:DUF4440 domain-containing protein [Anaerolineae bacterium]
MFTIINIEKTVLKFLTAWERCNLSTTAALLDNCFQMSGWTEQPLDRASFVMFQRVYNEAFPNWQFNITELERHGHDIYLTYRVRATHTGRFDPAKLGLPILSIEPTGETRVWPITYSMITVRDEKIVRFEIDTGPGGDLNGTLAWLNALTPAPIS